MQHSQHRSLHHKKNSNLPRKISRSDNSTYPKKFLAAWITGKRKNGAPQLTCNNNFANSIKKILPPEKTLSNKQALLREWTPLTKDEGNWLTYIDDYFESCRNTDYEDTNNNDLPEETWGIHELIQKFTNLSGIHELIQEFTTSSGTQRAYVTVNL